MEADFLGVNIFTTRNSDNYHCGRGLKMPLHKRQRRLSPRVEPTFTSAATFQKHRAPWQIEIKMFFVYWIGKKGIIK